MPSEILLAELWDAIERAGCNRLDFLISISEREPGWVNVKNGETTRSYPMGRETAVLLSAEIRHGILGRRDYFRQRSLRS